MYNHNKAQQSKIRVHISWDILYFIYMMTLLNGKIFFLFIHLFFRVTGPLCGEFTGQGTEWNNTYFLWDVITHPYTKCEGRLPSHLCTIWI